MHEAVTAGLDCAAVAAGDLTALRAALATAGLPVADVGEGPQRFYRFSRAGRVCAYGGMELHGGDALLRSIVVLPEWRGSGLGRQCVGLLEGIVREAGAGAVYLATLSAEGFFARLGYAAVNRDAAPAAILATRQLAGLCPARAVVMRKDLQGS